MAEKMIEISLVSDLIGILDGYVELLQEQRFSDDDEGDWHERRNRSLIAFVQKYSGHLRSMVKT